MKKQIVGVMMTLSLIMAAHGEGLAQMGSSSSTTTSSGSAGIIVPVTSGNGRVSSGTMRIERFEMQGSRIVAVGRMIDAAGAASSQTGSASAQSSGSTASGSATTTMTTQDINNTYSTLANGAGVNSLTPSSSGYSTDPSSVDRPYSAEGTSLSSSASGTIGATAMSMPVEITSASCDALHLNLGPAEGAAAQSVSQTMAVTITQASVPGMGGSNTLCQISNAVSSNGSTSMLVDHLNRLIGAAPASTR